ncbi:MAG TPA: SDR family NAD(P)-dependent oxidoreductase, partial [Planctomycetaceae bacterium]
MKPANGRGNGKSNGSLNGRPPVHGRVNGRAAGLARGDGYVLITGGAGFVGTNVASRMLSRGHEVAVFDNLSRPGVERNLAWLRKTYGRRVRLIEADVRDRAAVAEAVREADRVFHFAAQVAVTTSLADPRSDFEVN